MILVLDNQLCCTTNITTVARSCRFALYNICRTRPFLTREAAQLLVQVLVISRLDYCNSLLAGLPVSAIKPLQRIQNVAARLVFNLPKFSHVTPLLCHLHWLPVVARIRCKMIVLEYKAVDGTAYLQQPTSKRQTTHPRSIPPLNYLRWTFGTSIAKIKQRSISKITTLLYFGTTVVERAPCQCQDCRVAHQLQSSLRLCMAIQSPHPLLSVVRPGT